MPHSEHDDRLDKYASPASGIRKTPSRTVESGMPTFPMVKPQGAITNVPQFPYRVLVVDDETAVRETAKDILESKGYEVVAVADGLDALYALSKSLPDVILSDLNMPRMTGFELLEVVRQRFPNIAIIAMSGEFNAGEIPKGIPADAFLAKGQYSINELFQEVARVLSASPIRSVREKSDVVPLFVPRDSAGFLMIPCPNCLRENKLDAISMDGGIHQTICKSCNTPVKFEINHEIEPLIQRKPA